MRRILIVGLLLVSSVVSYALHVMCEGNATIIDNNGDTLLIFESNPELKFVGLEGEVRVFYATDTSKLAYSTNVENNNSFPMPEHGEGYAIKVDSVWEYFWIFDYAQLRTQVDTITAELSCENTELILEGTIPQIQYYNANNQLTTYARMCQVVYQDKQWDDERDEWIDSTAVAEAKLASSIVVGASPIPTDIIVVDQLATMLDLNEDTLQLFVDDPVAIKAHPQAVVTARPNERSNEVERPVDTETTIRRSAPLEIEFRANALNAEYYTWELFKGTEPLLTRNEAQHKYTFEEPGIYSANLTIKNSHGCEYVSESFEISVSESMLLVPNVFTPDGNGMNDEFRVVYRSIKEFNCKVYNRWGHLVYEWSDPAKGWDGTVNGRPVAEGAYYYVIRALGTDAEKGAKYIGKPKYTKLQKKQELPLGVYQLSGDINLLRGGE